MPSAKPPSPPLLLLLCVLGLGMWTYRDVGSFSYVQFDDPALVTSNPYVKRGITGDSLLWAFTFKETEGRPAEPMARELWAPLSFVSLAFDVQLGGLNSGLQHRVNLLLHLLGTALVFVFFQKLTNRPWVATFVAAVFCLHPMHAESVAWVSERKDVLCTFLVLCTLNLYLLWKQSDSGRALWWGALATFLLACLAKPMAIVTPLLLVWVDAWMARERGGDPESLRGQLKAKTPFIAVMAIMAALTVAMKLAHAAAAAGPGATLGQRLLEMPFAILFYLERTLLPKHLFASYGRYHHELAIGIVVGVAVIALATYGALRARARYPEWWFGWGWFLICLIPVLGFVYAGPSFTADRYTYLAHCGLAFAVSHAMTRLADRRRRWVPGLLFLGATYIVALAIWCHPAVSVWRNSGTLFHQGVTAQPGSGKNWNNMGAWLISQGDAERGVNCLRQAVAIGDEPDAFYNLARHLVANGGSAGEAKALLRRCIKIDPDHRWAREELEKLEAGAE